jgi:hypothetical protein
MSILVETSRKPDSSFRTQVRRSLSSALDLPTEPFLTQAVNHARKVAPERFSKLIFDLALDESGNGFDTVERGRDLYRFERVVLEDKSDAFLARDDEDDDCSEGEIGESEGHRDDKRGGGEEDARRAEDVE